MKDKKKYIYSFLVIVCLTAIVELFTFSKVNDQNNSLKTFIDNYKVFAIEIPVNISFAGEKVPINDFDVKERLDRELLVNTYWQSQTLLLHKRANRWFPIIEPILKQNNVPDDFKYLALAESGLMNVISPSGAVGYWQFLEATAKKYGLEINTEVDERYHVEKSTEAACRYFLEAYNKFGNWTLAASSYNMGITGIEKQIEKQKVNSYYDLFLNDETYRYIFRALALKEIITNPLKYGFLFKKTDLYYSLPTYTIVTDSSISNLIDFAEEYNTNYNILKSLNPWLRQDQLTNPRRKKYALKILNKEAYYANEIYEQENNSGINDTSLNIKSDVIFSE